MKFPRHGFTMRGAETLFDKDHHVIDLIIPPDINQYVDEKLGITLLKIREKFIKLLAEKKESDKQKNEAEFNYPVDVGRDDSKFKKNLDESGEITNMCLKITVSFFSSFDEYKKILKTSKHYNDLMEKIKKNSVTCTKAQKTFDEFEFKNFCGFCAKRTQNLLICTGCKKIKYCNQNCQKSHWKLHKQNCKI